MYANEQYSMRSIARGTCKAVQSLGQGERGKKEEKISINYVQQCLSQCEGMAMGEVRLIGSASTEIGNSSSTMWH